MAAAVKRSRRNQRSCQRKTKRNQTRWKKPQAKQGRKARCRQVIKRVKKSPSKNGSCKSKERQLTKKAKEDLSSCVEGLCKVVSAEADRLRKEKSEPTITCKVLLAALEHSLAKGTVRRSVTPNIKKTHKKKKPSVEVAEKMPSSSEQQATSNQKLPKQRKHSATPVSNEFS